MSGILGDIIVEARDLRSAASKRRRPFVEISIPNNQAVTYLNNGWGLVRRGKTMTRVRKPKTRDVLFEDRIWLVFYNLGFQYMNKDRNCRLKFNGYTKQIDILARDNENIFVIECRSSESEDPLNVRDALEYLVDKKGDIVDAIYKEWGRNCGKVHLLVVVSSQSARQLDLDYVVEKKDKSVFLWSRKDIEYIEALIEQIGQPAKYQIYSVIFAGKKQPTLKKECLALKSKIAGRKFYAFLISAKELLNYAYVHHRCLTGIVEASQAYQRMLRSDKIKKIAKFIDLEDGYFPNSVIVNFTEKLRWDKKEGSDEMAVGRVMLPGRYGCAWIIDGQHRLYGAAVAEKDIVVPVLAFEGMDQIDQANLFVEINEKQKKVPKDLLWDLYTDIYADSTDAKQKKLYQIAKTAKIMADSGPLKGHIDIPSRPQENGVVKLTLTTVCSTIKDYSPWDSFKHPTDDEKTPENAARLMNANFGILKSLWPEDWARGKLSVLLSNNGFGVFTMIFNDIVRHIAAYPERRKLLYPHKADAFEEEVTQKYLRPVIEYLKHDEKMQESIRSLTGRGPQSDNAGILELKIQDFVPDFAPPRIGKVTALPEKETPALAGLKEKAELAEEHLRSFVRTRLKEHYGDKSGKWWKQGVTKGAKAKADDKWKREVVRKPYLRREKNQNDLKFNFLGFGEIKDIVIYGVNWEHIFETDFVNKKMIERRINDITALRDPAVHRRSVDHVDVADGIAGLLWLSNCMGDPELNPYY